MNRLHRNQRASGTGNGRFRNQGNGGRGMKTGPRNGTGPRGGTPSCDKPKN